VKYVPRISFELELEYTRSRGPGGQHVNKTNSACLLRWNVPGTVCFSEEDKMLLLSKLRMTNDGDIVLRSDEHRDQESNRKKVLEKLDAMIEQAFFVPKKRKATKPTRSSQRKRQDEKRNRGEVKAGRGKVDWSD
jgi:ribosome-associated protein